MAEAGRKGLFGIGARRTQYEVELWKPASVQITYLTKAKVLVQLLDHSKCMICQAPLQFESRTGLGIFFGDQLFDQMLRTAYKCRECGAPICMEHARTSRCRRCGGNTFDRALKEDTKTDEDVIEELRGTFPEAADQLTEAWAREAVDQLVEIYQQNPEGFVAGHSGPAVQELGRIGRMLHSRGGFDLMRAAHFLFRHKTRGIPGAPRNLEHMWDGIGPWLG